MNEITKLYENANVEKHLVYFECHIGRSSMRCCPVSSDERDKECSSCFFRDKMKEVYEYPPFTAEKQLELIKWLSDTIGNFYYDIETGSFEETLAKLINKLWEDLTEKQKQQIKEILE